MPGTSLEIHISSTPLSTLFSHRSPLPLPRYTGPLRRHLLVQASSSPFPFRIYELVAPFPNHPVGKEWLLAAFILKFEDGEEKDRGKSN